MKSYRVGIVGFGWVAGAHLKTFSELPNFQPVAILSRQEARSGRAQGAVRAWS